jgi:hypothetical protein
MQSSSANSSTVRAFFLDRNCSIRVTWQISPGTPVRQNGPCNRFSETARSGAKWKSVFEQNQTWHDLNRHTHATMRTESSCAGNRRSVQRRPRLQTVIQFDSFLPPCPITFRIYVIPTGYNGPREADSSHQVLVEQAVSRMRSCHLRGRVKQAATVPIALVGDAGVHIYGEMIERIRSPAGNHHQLS